LRCRRKAIAIWRRARGGRRRSRFPSATGVGCRERPKPAQWAVRGNQRGDFRLRGESHHSSRS
jgi:hypothetical protein